MSFGDSVHTYSILSVGDGLVSQIPALVIATTAGVLVTKTASDDSLGDEIGGQLFNSNRPVYIGAGILFVIALMPGLPKLPFLGVAGILVLIASRRRPAAPSVTEAEPGTDPAPPTQPDDERHLDEFLLTDRAVVEVGARLVPFIQSKRVKGLSERITALRREFSRTSGLWVPPIRVNSNLLLQPEEYRILIAGRRVAGGELRTEQLMAILPEGRQVSIPGEEAVEPAFGLSARWITSDSVRLAEIQGCTVVDPLSVLITHLGEILNRFAHELLTRESLKQMLDRAREFAPTIVDEIKPETIRMGSLHQVLVSLAEDRIPLSDIALILESIVNHAPDSKSSEELTDSVRRDLGRLVCERFRGTDGRLRVVSMEPRLDIRLRQSVQKDQVALEVGSATRMIEAIQKAWKESERLQMPLALLVDQKIRRPLKRLIARSTPDIGVIAYQEVPDDLVIDSVVMLEFDEIIGADAAPESRQFREAA
jgi:flagellar biosynthesis protein FlhA